MGSNPTLCATKKDTLAVSFFVAQRKYCVIKSFRYLVNQVGGNSKKKGIKFVRFLVFLIFIWYNRHTDIIGGTT